MLNQTMRTESHKFTLHSSELNSSELNGGRRAVDADPATTLRWEPGFTHRLFEAFTLWIFGWYCRLGVTGIENLPDGPYILSSNHSSHLDSLALMAATGDSFSDFGLLAAGDYFYENPAAHAWFSRVVHMIPVSRSGGASALGRTIALCRKFVGTRGGKLIVYPEGTRSSGVEMQPFKRGVGLMAAKLGLPVVPAYIEGCGKLMPRGWFFPAPGRITVRFGTPIQPDAATSHDEFVRALEQSVRALGEQA